MKITPGHDFNDYELGIKHGLEPINILNPDGTLNAETPAPFSGMDRFDARREIIKSLKDIQMLERIEPHKLSIPRAERSDTILEPYLTDQWYLNTDLIGKEALSLVKKSQSILFLIIGKNLFLLDERVKIGALVGNCGGVIKSQSGMTKME